MAVETRTEEGFANELGIFTGLNLEAVVRGWIKGFHAALYSQPLPPETHFATQTPFPTGSIEDGDIRPKEIPRQHAIFVEELKRNRMARNIDAILCNNDKLRYECVWVRVDDGGCGCIFALDLYGWKQLGDIRNFPARGCTGLYRTGDAKVPRQGTVSTHLQFRVENVDPMDPFAA